MSNLWRNKLRFGGLLADIILLNLEKLILTSIPSGLVNGFRNWQNSTNKIFLLARLFTKSHRYVTIFATIFKNYVVGNVNYPLAYLAVN